MVKKLRYVAVLAVVLSLIYIQQNSVIYAGESDLGGGKKTAEEETLPTKEEKEPEEGEEKEPGEGEDKPPTEGGEKEPEEGEEKPPEGGDNKEPEEGEGKPPTEGNDKPPVEEEKVIIEEYRIEIPEPNGKQGYYIKKPEITICHVSKAGVTRYCLKHGDKKLEEKTLKEKGEKAVIAEKIFQEGKNILYVWMEDEEGKRLEKYDLKREFLIDTKAPEIQMSVPKGFDSWYQGQVTLTASGEDSGSGVARLSCREGRQNLGSISKRQGEFVLSKASASGKGVDIAVTVEDKAGNKSERMKTVFIDKNAPQIMITGAKNYMITSKTVNLAYKIDEENMLQEFYSQTVWENAKGEKKLLSSAEWENNSTGKILTQTLKNDGIYHVKIQAKDMSGHMSANELQVIVDKTNPVIRYVETLNGQQLKKFKWEYPVQQMIRDFTTYVYEMRIDGKLYHMGETISMEGKHRMTVKVMDAAGNKAQAKADFVVDHTAPEIMFHNIEGGQEYEEERTFKVGLEREEDEIRQIRINGENQKIDSGRKTYEYTLHTCKDYEVTVKAADRAGNEAVKSVFFRIVPKKSLMEKIVEPVKLRWSMGKKADMRFPETTKQGEWQRKRMPVLCIIVSFAVFIGVLAVFLIKLVKQRQIK